jgi:endoglucanase
MRPHFVKATVAIFGFATVLLIGGMISISAVPEGNAVIRINLLGYKPNGIKVAVWGSMDSNSPRAFQLVNATTGKIVFESSAGKPMGSYGPFTQTLRLDFSSFKKAGVYYLKCGQASSPVFTIGKDVYKGTADFCLKYMRQQRSGFNPYLKDSCHTHDGYTMYGPMPDSTHIDVSGGWHDATDYLQYSMTSANATYHLLAAYRDFPEAFADNFESNGLEGKNSIADVLDEARWGLDWLMKMHPRSDWMFNQLADDRDHAGFRLPVNDPANYGNGKERPVYFVTGEPQGLGKFKNKTEGTSSIAGKFSSAFALGSQIFKIDKDYAGQLRKKAFSAYDFGLKKPGFTQTACYREPYFYEESNWVDDMELAATQLYNLTGAQKYLNDAFGYSIQEKQTPWLGRDTASHYQWYPFINLGHYELSKIAAPDIRNQVINFYKDGIALVSGKAMGNAFFRGVPFIWCSNNLQTSFAIQCLWYRKLTGDTKFAELEQATFDWLFGCNPWGTSMVVGLPENGDFPDDPHSSFNVLKGYQTFGGLVDGPIYGTIYRQQRGVNILHGDEYAMFQSSYVVYHDDSGDYATNEPTMDGTASLIYLLAAQESNSN